MVKKRCWRDNSRQFLLAARVGEPTDDGEHRARLLHRYDSARVVCIDGAPAGLLKTHRTDTEWVVVQLQITPALQERGIGDDDSQFYMRRAPHASAETEAE